MHASSFVHIFVLCFTFTVHAYRVTFPSLDALWTSEGPNLLSWVRVATDPTQFATVLVNQNRTVLPVNQQPLITLVDGTLGSITIAPAQGGSFPVGAGFQVNLVKDASDPDTILAQSPVFTIIAGSGMVSQPTMPSAVTVGASATQAEAHRPTIYTTVYVSPSSTPNATDTTSDISSDAGLVKMQLAWAGYIGFVTVFGVWLIQH